MNWSSALFKPGKNISIPLGTSCDCAQWPLDVHIGYSLYHYAAGRHRPLGWKCRGDVGSVGECLGRSELDPAERLFWDTASVIRVTCIMFLSTCVFIQTDRTYTVSYRLHRVFGQNKSRRRFLPNRRMCALHSICSLARFFRNQTARSSRTIFALLFSKFAYRLDQRITHEEAITSVTCATSRRA